MLILLLITIIFVPIYLVVQKSMFIDFETDKMATFADELSNFDFATQESEIDDYLEDNNSSDYIIRVLDKDLNIIYTTHRTPTHGKSGDSSRFDHFKVEEFSENAVPTSYIRSSSKNDYEELILKKSYNKNGEIFYIYCRESFRTIDSMFAYTNRNMLIILIVFMLVSATAILIFVSFATKPIKKVSQITEKIAEKDYSVRYNGRIYKDEIGVLASNINEMADTIQDNITSLKNYNFLLKEDLNSLSEYKNMHQRVVTNITHELKTPLAIISSQIEMMNSIQDPEKKELYYSSAMDEINKMSKLISRLLNYSAKEKDIFKGEVKIVNLSDLILNLCESIKSYTESKKIKLICKIDDDCIMNLSKEHVEHVFNNYLMNAIRHTPKGGKIQVEVLKQTESARLSVYNDGSSIPEENQDKIWYEFSTSGKDNSSTNLGLGLFIVKEISIIDHTQCGYSNYPNGVEFWFDFINE
jgi:signal transduction histidine kinase